MARAFLVALFLLVVFPTLGPAQEKDNPMRDVGAFAAIDGILVASAAKDFPFTLRIVDGDARKTQAADGQLWIPNGDRMFQVTVTPVADVLPGAARQPADRELLAAHAAWECQEHNEQLHVKQTAQPEFLEGHGRTWSHWTYDLSPLTEKLKKDPKQPLTTPGPKTQHLLTTVVGKYIIVLVCTTMTGQDEADSMTGLFKIAKTFVVHPQPLTEQQVTELCSQKQP